MTDAEALSAAIARWGSSAVVHVARAMHDDGSVAELYSVGRLTHDQHAWSAIGQGATFEAAFADADGRTR